MKKLQLLLTLVPIFGLIQMFLLYAKNLPDPSKNESKFSTIIQEAHKSVYEKMANPSEEAFATGDPLFMKRAGKLPLYPEEGDIDGFPVLAESSKSDLEAIAQYYNDVGQAYFKEAERTLVKAAEYQKRLSHLKQQSSIEMFRTQDQKLETSHTITRRKDYLFSCKAPTKSEKHLARDITKTVLREYWQNYRELKQNSEAFAFKGMFYTAVSLEISGDGAKKS